MHAPLHRSHDITHTCRQRQGSGAGSAVASNHPGMMILGGPSAVSENLFGQAACPLYRCGPGWSVEREPNPGLEKRDRNQSSKRAQPSVENTEPRIRPLSASPEGSAIRERVPRDQESPGGKHRLCFRKILRIEHGSLLVRILGRCQLQARSRSSSNMGMRACLKSSGRSEGGKCPSPGMRVTFNPLMEDLSLLVCGQITPLKTSRFEDGGHVA